MFVVFLVASIAIQGCVLEHGRLVAGVTLGVDMLALEGKFRRAVVESRFLPTALDMAIGALGPEAFLVFVVFLVTGDTGGLELVLVQQTLVAIIALQVIVLSS